MILRQYANLVAQEILVFADYALQRVVILLAVRNNGVVWNKLTGVGLQVVVVSINAQSASWLGGKRNAAVGDGLSEALMVGEVVEPVDVAQLALVLGVAY